MAKRPNTGTSPSHSFGWMIGQDIKMASTWKVMCCVWKSDAALKSTRICAPCSYMLKCIHICAMCIACVFGVCYVLWQNKDQKSQLLQNHNQLCWWVYNISPSHLLDGQYCWATIKTTLGFWLYQVLILCGCSGPGTLFFSVFPSLFLLFYFFSLLNFFF